MGRVLFFTALIVAAVLLIRRFLANSGSAMSPDQARRLLEVGPDATTEEIIAAHKRLIAKVHPDNGGSAQLAAQVNAARDLLLRNLPK